MHCTFNLIVRKTSTALKWRKLFSFFSCCDWRPSESAFNFNLKKKMHTQTQQILDIQLHFHAADGEDSLFRPDGVIKTALCSTYFFMSGASNIINFSSISLLSHTENTNLKTAASRFIADRENKPLENNKPGQGLCGSRVKKPIFHSIIQYSCCHQ